MFVRKYYICNSREEIMKAFVACYSALGWSNVLTRDRFLFEPTLIRFKFILVHRQWGHITVNNSVYQYFLLCINKHVPSVGLLPCRCCNTSALVFICQSSMLTQFQSVTQVEVFRIRKKYVSVFDIFLRKRKCIVYLLVLCYWRYSLCILFPIGSLVT